MSKNKVSNLPNLQSPTNNDHTAINTPKSRFDFKRPSAYIVVFDYWKTKFGKKNKSELQK